ncbi:MAG TPA: hypothetical protein DEF79_11020 [Gammaproteobacteria bacterium]|nr:hypothetical protein [Gammaproteobacteria bacterium]
MGFLTLAKRETQPRIATTPRHAKKITASMCSIEKNGPSCARAEVEHNEAIRQTKSLITVPRVDMLSRTAHKMGGEPSGQFKTNWE